MDASIKPDAQADRVVLRPINRNNWRAVIPLKVAEAQSAYVSEPSYYLALCCYENLWQPLAMYVAEQPVGFMMWAIDSNDGSCWLGGILVDQRYQRRGYGRQAVQAAIALLSEQYGHQHFALSYQPANSVAQKLYQSLGFSETDEWEDDEIVARLSLAKQGEAGLPDAGPTHNLS